MKNVSFVLIHKYEDCQEHHSDVWKVFKSLENAKIELKKGYELYLNNEEYYEKDEVDLDQSFIDEDGKFACIVSSFDECKYDIFEIDEVESE